MRIEQIAERGMTVELEPEDSLVLALACNCAATRLGGSEDDLAGEATRAGFDEWALVQLYQALTATFEAGALAALTPSYITSREQRQALTLAGIRDGALLEPTKAHSRGRDGHDTVTAPARPAMLPRSVVAEAVGDVMFCEVFDPLPDTDDGQRPRSLEAMHVMLRRPVTWAEALRTVYKYLEIDPDEFMSDHYAAALETA